jgi:hypothetical protein
MSKNGGALNNRNSQANWSITPESSGFNHAKSAFKFSAENHHSRTS